MSEKKCSSCKKVLNRHLFSKRKTSLDGLRSSCKKCEIIAVNKYNKTKKGLVNKIYQTQKTSSKKRNHEPPNYSLSDLRKWMFIQPNFNQLYDDWVNSGYDKWLIPSCDRDKDSKPYTLNNITITTWAENKNKRHFEIKNGINNKHSVPIIGTHIKTGEKLEFFSISEAGRNGFQRSNIYKCCIGTRNHAGKYSWKYKNV